MPLNINSVGSSGVGGSGSGDVNTSMIIRPSSSYDTYKDLCPSYYVDASQLTTKRNLSRAGSVPTFTSQIFIFKDEIYAITLDSLYCSYNSYNNSTAHIQKVTFSTMSVTYTDILSFNVLISSDPDTTYNYTNTDCNIISRPIAIPSTDYIYYIEYHMSKTVDSSSGNTHISYIDKLYRFDGYTSEEVTFVSNESTTRGTLWLSKAFTFTPLDHAATRFMIGYKTTNNNVVIIDFNKNKVYDGTFPKYINTSEKGYYDTTTAQTVGILIMDTVGYFLWGYRTSSGQSIFRSTCVDILENDDHSFTISNLRYVGNISYNSGGHAGDGWRINECGIYTQTAYGYSSFYTPYIILYDQGSESVMCKPIMTDSKSSPNGNQWGIPSSCTYVLNIAFVDRLNNEVRYINSCGNSSSSSSSSSNITTFSFEDITGVTYITEYSESAESVIHAMLKKGDIVYCSSVITDYKLQSSQSYQSIPNQSRKFIITMDGKYDIRSSHKIVNYRPVWIVQSVNGGFSFINISKVSSTNISGYFIKDMLINNMKITEDGLQSITLNDIDDSGVYVSMKGVK